jgi:geranylgeranyl reductase family protein
MADYDVIVVGGGPAGAMAARCCAKEGLTTLLLEEHGTVGHPVQCAGLLSAAAFRECEVGQDSVLQEVSGARIIGGAGVCLTFDAGVTKAFVVDRGALDREMVAAAAKSGAEVRVKTACQEVRDGSVITRGVQGREVHSFRILIAADGPGSAIARHQGFGRAGFYLSGLQAEVVAPHPPGLVTISPHVSPDFFGWTIPVGEGRVRIGLAGKKDVKPRFSAFARPYLAQCTHLVSGTIPLGVIPRTYGKRTLVIGDAAGFAKPTSGGGVYTGVRSARHAAATAVASIREGKFDDMALSRYERAWQEDFGRELSTGMRLLQLRQAMRPSEVDKILSALSKPGMVQEIVTLGDMDRPRRLASALIKNPRLLTLWFGLIRPFVISFLT